MIYDEPLEYLNSIIFNMLPDNDVSVEAIYSVRHYVNVTIDMLYDSSDKQYVKNFFADVGVESNNYYEDLKKELNK